MSDDDEDASCDDDDDDYDDECDDNDDNNNGDYMLEMFVPFPQTILTTGGQYYPHVIYRVLTIDYNLPLLTIVATNAFFKFLDFFVH